MDDVVGLVMVQVISNLGPYSASISAVTIIRPLLVSVAFAVCTPLVCVCIAKPLTIWLNSQRMTHPKGAINLLLSKEKVPWIVHTCILISFIVGSTYAGTSNLFAAYIAGASVSWWDSEVPHRSCETLSTEIPLPGTPSTENFSAAQSEISEHLETNNTETPENIASEPRKASSSGHVIFEKYYLQPLDRILKPFFFVSIIFQRQNSHLTLEGFHWLLYSTHGDVRQFNCLEGNHIYHSDDGWQAVVWDLAPSHTIRIMPSHQTCSLHEAPKITNVAFLGTSSRTAQGVSRLDFYTRRPTPRVSNIAAKP